MEISKHHRSLDELETDLLVTTLYADERPPQGVTGLIDWRMHGYLSRKMLDGLIRGESDERILVSLHERLPARRLLLLGLGSPAQFTLDRCKQVAIRLAKVLGKIKAPAVALSIPPARDEKRRGETERAFLSILERNLSRRKIVLQWLDQTEQDH